MTSAVKKTKVLQRFFMRALCVFVALFIAVVAIRVFPKAPLHAKLPLSRVVLAADGSVLSVQLASDQRYRYWVPRHQFSASLIETTLIKEDRWFYYHPGINPYRMLKAAVSTYSGGARQGGSTLSMQLARMYYDMDTRTLLGKLKQMGAAMWLEACYGKNDLLEAYLNLAPYGGNIEGAGTASLLYFNKPVSKLTLAESITLAVLPQQPNVRVRDSKQANLQAARVLLFEQYRAEHPELQDNLALSALIAQGLELKKIARSDRAAHAVRWALSAQDAQSPEIRTRIEPALQDLLESQITLYLRSKANLGLKNAAVMLVDHRTGGIVAYAGSAQFSNAAIFGQVDGLRAKRSPGSTLKPLIYALALDQGLIHAKTLLRDVPASFGYFAPENFDLRFQGPVDATQALIRSRNLPAVFLASKLQPDLYASLQTAGVTRLASREHYGLSLTLGGGEITALELARIYTALAGDGSLKNISVLQTPVQATTTQRLVSPEAAWIVRRMLEENPRTDNARKAEQLKVAWKTGTSWGFRDAWSAGIFGQYVMVVWVGNFDGSSQPGLIGRNSAAPLFFGIVDRLHAYKRINTDRELVGALNVQALQVCASNGELPNRWCPRKAQTYYIPGRSPIAVSELHQPVVVDRANAVRCDERALLRLQRGEVLPGLRLEIAEHWPAQMAAAFQQAGVLKKSWPRCDRQTLNGIASDAPSIIEPQEKLIMRIRPAALASTTISLKALGSEPLHWFVEGALIGVSNNGQRFSYRPNRLGQQQLRVVDSAGQSATRVLVLEAY